MSHDDVVYYVMKCHTTILCTLSRSVTWQCSTHCHKVSHDNTTQSVMRCHTIKLYTVTNWYKLCNEVSHCNDANNVMKCHVTTRHSKSQHKPHHAPIYAPCSLSITTPSMFTVTFRVYLLKCDQPNNPMFLSRPAMLVYRFDYAHVHCTHTIW